MAPLGARGLREEAATLVVPQGLAPDLCRFRELAGREGRLHRCHLVPVEAVNVPAEH